MNLSLTSRVMMGGIVGSVLVGFLFLGGMALMRPVIQNATTSAVVESLDHDACNADPSSWGWTGGDIAFFAYDRSGRSTNPKALPLDPTLLHRALTTNKVAISETEEHAFYVTPYASGGPCAVFLLRARNTQTTVQPRFLGVLVSSVAGAVLLAVMLTFFLVVRPLQRRIEALASAAHGVGSPEFVVPRVVEGDLGRIAKVLAGSHTRIVETQQALTERNRALEDHLAGIAHDLRTPLTSTHLALEAVATESEGTLQHEARRALADVIYLSSMVENLHQAARLRYEVDDASPGEVDLCELVRRLERRFAIVGRHANVAVAASAPEHPVWASCVPTLAERAVANLIQNAIEHNSEPGHVAVTLSVIDSGRRFELVVADDGPGLPEGAVASLEHETFLEERARRRGPALGMLIIAEVARRSGWSLTYEPMEPTGLRARLEGDVIESPD